MKTDDRRVRPLPGEAVRDVLKALSLGLAPDKEEALVRYAELVREGSRKAALVSRGDVDAIERRHFAESLALLLALEERGLVASPAVDLGSGAGFPALPIKIARPELALTLIESNEKKAAFLEKAVRELGLADVTVLPLRAEDAGRLPEQRAAYALALARAVAPLRVLAEYALPLLSAGGALAAPKGSSAAREVREAETALAALGGTVEEILELRVPARGRPPALVIVRKEAETPQRYPRRPGIPRKRPL